MKLEGGHPPRNDLELLMGGELPRSKAAGVIRHLLAGCPECLAVTAHLWRLGDRPPGLKDTIRELVLQVFGGGPVRNEPGLG